MVRIALANVQYPTNPAHSVTLAEAAIRDAAQAGAAIVCFPECFVPGYRWPGRVAARPDPVFLERAWSALAAVASDVRVAVVLGTERVDADGVRLTALVINPDDPSRPRVCWPGDSDLIPPNHASDAEPYRGGSMRTSSKCCLLLTLVSLTALLTGPVLHAAEITLVVSGGPLPSVMGTLVPMFERATGHTVTVSTKGGQALANDVKQGAVDLVITDATAVDTLVTSGDIAADSRTPVMISKIGLAVKAGAPKPDISTPDKLKAVLLSARTIGYSQFASGQYFLKVAERLGIADAVKAKAVIPQGEPVGAGIARGTMEIGVQQVAELLAVPGVDLIGELPGDLQLRMPIAAGVPSRAKDAATARALIAYLRSAPGQAALKEKGMDLP